MEYQTQATRYSTLALGAKTMEQTTPAPFTPIVTPAAADIVIDPAQRFQPFDGVGAALTDSAAYCLMHYLTAEQRHTLLTQMFGPGSEGGFSTVRVAMAASDFVATSSYYSYNDVPEDIAMANFSVKDSPCAKRVIPVVKEILAINPGVKVILVPWGPPGWMKVSGQMTNPTPGSYVNPDYYDALALYQVKAIQAFEGYGIPIWALSPQNEPGQKTAYPGCNWSASQMMTYIGDSLVPALKNANLRRVKLLIHDHNFDATSSTYSDLAELLTHANIKYVNGVAWHGYSGWPSTPDDVAKTNPDLEHHMTEMRAFLTEEWQAGSNRGMQLFAADLVIGSMRYGVRSVTAWNLALDQFGNPTTVNMTGRAGVVTIPNSKSGAVFKNGVYWALAHLGRFVKPGAVRVASTTKAWYSAGTDVQSVAFHNPDDSIVAYVFNNADTVKTFQLADASLGESFPVTMQPGELATFVWSGRRERVAEGATVPVTVPAKPTLTASGTSSGAALSWSAPAAGTYPISAYRVYRGKDEASLTLLAEVPGNATSYTDASAPNVSMTYALVAVSPAGPSPRSDAKTATSTKAATVGTTGRSSVASGLTISANHTASDDTGTLIVAVGYQLFATGTTQVASVTYAGRPLTKVTTASSGTAGTGRAVDLWRLDSPPPGVESVEITISAPGNVTAGFVSVNVPGSGTLGTPATTASASTTSLSVSTTSPAAANVISAYCYRNADDTPTPGTGVAAVQNVTISNLYLVVGVRAGGTSVASAWSHTTADNAALAAVPVT